MTESRKIERLPPQNMEAEEAVLGALLIDPDAIIRLATILRAQDFYRQKHGWIYDAVLTLHERREPEISWTLFSDRKSPRISCR